MKITLTASGILKSRQKVLTYGLFVYFWQTKLKRANIRMDNSRTNGAQKYQSERCNLKNDLHQVSVIPTSLSLMFLACVIPLFIKSGCHIYNFHHRVHIIRQAYVWGYRRAFGLLEPLFCPLHMRKRSRRKSMWGKMYVRRACPPSGNQPPVDLT